LNKTFLSCFGLAALLLFLTRGSELQARQNASTDTNGKTDSSGEVVILNRFEEPQRPANKQRNPFEIMSDTQGVDFGPYLSGLIKSIREHWYRLIPDEARPPMMKSGQLAIELAVKKDGNIADIKMATSSGDLALDKAAWASITGSTPFPPLPAAFTGDHLALRLHFTYNPSPTTTSAKAASQIVEPRLISQESVAYPKKARKDRIEGTVQLAATINADGKVTQVVTTSGNLILGEAASSCVRKWRFEPSQVDGKPVASQIQVEFEFHLDGNRVTARTLETLSLR